MTDPTAGSLCSPLLITKVLASLAVDCRNAEPGGHVSLIRSSYKSAYDERRRTPMAFYRLGEAQCPLCGRVLERLDDTVVGYSFLEPPDPLARFSHSLMHRTCFGNWDQRSTFIAKFNALFGPHQQMDEHGVVHTRPWWKLWGSAI